MTVDLLDQTGKKIDEVTLNPQIFEAKINPAVVAQSIRVRLQNARTGTAATQTRGDVRGGGRKPWRQKGTGRARQGSIRAPQWKGGGVVHGPQPRNIEADMPKSMRRAALFSALTDKAQQKQVIVVKELSLEKPKTKMMATIAKALPVGRKMLLVLAEKNESIERSGRNLPDVKIMTARVLHPYEILNYSTVVFLQDSLQTLEEVFLKENEKSTKEQKTAKATTAAKSTRRQPKNNEVEE